MQSGIFRLSRQERTAILRNNTQGGMGLTWVLMFCANVCLSLTFRLERVDTITVRTTMRLWHDLHVASGTAYDFEHMFAPAQTQHEFMACVLNDEVHALARCEVVKPAATCLHETGDNILHKPAVTSNRWRHVMSTS